MINNKPFLLFLLFFNICLSQQMTTNGTISFKCKVPDTITFCNGIISKEYYDIPSFSAAIVNNKFIFKHKFSYPQMYSHQIKSIKDSVIFKDSNLFLDNHTKKIEINEKIRVVNSDGVTQKEFKEVFMPFVTETKDYLKKDLSNFFRSENFKIKLLDYVKIHPNSFVALWFVIKGLELDGFDANYKKILPLFSKKMKSLKPWQKLDSELKLIKFILNEELPVLTFKDEALLDKNLVIKKNQYTLVDFWFSRCKPCLEITPELKKINEQFKDKGFSLVSISVDKEINIEKWKAKIKELQMNWDNYIDINGKIANENKITKYPTNFLIDKNGIIIKQDIDLEELVVFLQTQLK